METSTIPDEKYIEELTKFARAWARANMPKYDSEILTVAIRPTPDFRDKISQALWEKGGVFGGIPHNCYCRQFLYSGDDYKERTLEDITTGDPADIKAKKMILINPINRNYYRMKYEGVKYEPSEKSEKSTMVGQGWEVDMEWDGSKLVVNENSKHRTIIT